MVRSFTAEPVDGAVLDAVLDLARRAPSAGNSQGTDLLVLDQPETTARYWDVTLPPPRRDRFAWPGLLTAPVLVVVWVSPAAYVARYAEPDKATTGLGAAAGAWPVPYWFIDGGMVVDQLLLALTDAGLGACFFGLFEHEPALQAAFGVPEPWRGIGTIAVGHPAPDRPSPSAGRPRRPLPDVVHRGSW
jgi:nitroreductase